MAHILTEMGFAIVELNKDPKKRMDTLDSFRYGFKKLLVTSSSLCGIDLGADIVFAINFDFPITENGQCDVKTYVHRVGRIGRFGMHHTFVLHNISFLIAKLIFQLRFLFQVKWVSP